MIQDGHPKYSKQYKATLTTKLRKAFEQYRAANGMKEADAIRELLRLALEKKANPFFKSKFEE
jgi:hypothetical protein